MAAKPTISDVAARAGVSKGAVSFALNGRPGVSSGTRDRIFDAVNALGYTPSAAAKALATRRSGALGLILNRRPETLGSDPFFPPFIAGVESILAPEERSLTLRFVGSDNERRGYERAAAAHSVDGVILTDLRSADPRPALLDRLEMPYVSLNRPDVPSKGPAICLDGRWAVRHAVEHLVRLGHRRIAHVAGPAEYLHVIDRSGEWRSALRAAGIRPGPLVESDFTAAGGAAATEKLLRARNRPTAIVYANDAMAMAGLAVAHRRGLDVPGELSIVGYDDAELAAHLFPPLSTVHTDAFDWGRTAARALLDLLEGNHLDDIQMNPPTFVDRASTGPVPTKKSTHPHKGDSP